jgi:hypothetical protein
MNYSKLQQVLNTSNSTGSLEKSVQEPTNTVFTCIKSKSENKLRTCRKKLKITSSIYLRQNLLEVAKWSLFESNNVDIDKLRPAVENSFQFGHSK